jgi:hypothetical protein
VSFLAPIWLAAAAIASLGVVALHLITTQRPPASALPTARFVPRSDARASSRAARPADLLLLLLRCAALMLLGAAFAGPVTRPGGTSLARVIVADRSRAAQGDVRDSAGALARPGDVVVLFDSSATIVSGGAADSIRAIAAGRYRGAVSAALVAARRAGRDLARGADSVELDVVSPLTADELDAASALMFAQWPGRVRLVRTKAARPAAAAVTLVSDAADDALRPVIAALNARAGGAGTHVSVRIVRTPPGSADSATARDGAAVVSWPRGAAGARAAAEGLWSGDATLVAPLSRIAFASRAPGSRIVARWADGAPAAVEWPLGRGCIRFVGVGLPLVGDVTLEPAFGAVAGALLAPCDAEAAGAAIPDSLARTFARAGPAATAAALRSTEESSPLAPWLLGAALVVLLGELMLRRDGGAVHA